MTASPAGDVPRHYTDDDVQRLLDCRFTRHGMNRDELDEEIIASATPFAREDLDAVSAGIAARAVREAAKTLPELWIAENSIADAASYNAAIGTCQVELFRLADAMEGP